MPFFYIFFFIQVSNISQVQRLRDELASSRAQLATWDERINQARAACTAWQFESEDAKRKASIAEQQRDEVRLLIPHNVGEFSPQVQSRIVSF